VSELRDVVCTGYGCMSKIRSEVYGNTGIHGTRINIIVINNGNECMN